MFGLREAGVLGASVAVAGGVAYLIWNYASFSSGTKTTPEARPGEEDGGSPARDGDDTKEETTEREEAATRPTVAVEAAEPPVAPAKAPTSHESRTQVLVLGLDGAGKTSLLYRLASGGLEQDMQPTQGFNAVSINRENLQVEFLEIGGKEELRPYWQKYMSKALLLVFVVDASSPERFAVAKRHLHELLTSDPDLPLMVLANKQDLPGACSITDLHDALSLSEIGDRRVFLIGTHTKKTEEEEGAELSSGLQDARDLIVQMVSERR